MLEALILFVVTLRILFVSCWPLRVTGTLNVVVLSKIAASAIVKVGSVSLSFTLISTLVSAAVALFKSEISILKDLESVL